MQINSTPPPTPVQHSQAPREKPVEDVQKEPPAANKKPAEVQQSRVDITV